MQIWNKNGARSGTKMHPDLVPDLVKPIAFKTTNQ